MEKGSTRSEETRTKHAASITAAWADPAKRERIIQGQLHGWLERRKAMLNAPLLVCTVCGAGPYKGKTGLGVHQARTGCKTAVSPTNGETGSEEVTQ